MKDITVLVDSREQKPWQFDIEEPKSGYSTRITSSEVTGLDCGDYSVKGYEDLIRIERKMGFGELFNNMIPKTNKDRFEREMEKLQQIKYKYILIESNLSKDIMGLSVGQMFKGPPCSKVFRWLNEIEIKYGVHVNFVGDCGPKVARLIFDNVIKNG